MYISSKAEASCAYQRPPHSTLQAWDVHCRMQQSAAGHRTKSTRPLVFYLLPLKFPL